MGMRRHAPRADNGLRAERQKGLLILSVSICLRLEIIAILSGVIPPAGNFPATSCDAIPPGGEHVSADKLRVRHCRGLNLRSPGFLRCPGPGCGTGPLVKSRAAIGRNPFKLVAIS